MLTMADRALFAIKLLLVISQIVDIFALDIRIPKSIEICKRNDEECLFRSVTNTMKQMNNGGVPSLGIPEVNPLKIPEMSINQGTGAVTIKLKFTDQEIIGLDNLVIQSTKGDFTDKSYRLEINYTVPKLTLKGDYSISGKVLVLPIRGEGKNVLALDNMEARITMTGRRLYEKDGEQYVEVVCAFTVTKTTRIHFKFDNLFNGNKALSDNMNKFLNDNWGIVWRELQPSIQASISDIFNQFLSTVYNQIPYKLMHPVA